MIIPRLRMIFWGPSNPFTNSDPSITRGFLCLPSHT